jgi:penicillin-binding protein 2
LNQRIRKREQDPDIARRARILLYAAFAVFGLLCIRLYWLQVVGYDHYRELSENNRLRLRTVRAPRGPIFDRKGRAIAETQGSYDLVCSPVDVRDPEAEVRFLAQIVEFDTDEDEILGKIREAMRTNPYTSITVARDLRFEQVSVIEFNREGLPGFSVMVEAKRSYPYGTAFAHVLGYVGEVSKEELKASRDERLAMGDLVGKYGLERAMDDVLRGINGGRKVEVDAAGRDQRMVEEVPSITGGPLYTTLDVDLQKAAPEGRLAGLERGPAQADAEQGAPGDVRAGVHRQAVYRAGRARREPDRPDRPRALRGVVPPGQPHLPLLEGEGARPRRHVSGGGAILRRVLLCHGAATRARTDRGAGAGRGFRDDHGDRPAGGAQGAGPGPRMEEEDLEGALDGL